MKNLLSRLIALNWLQWSFGPVVAFGFAGNLILLLCLIRYRAKITPINMIIGNMALADMMTIVIVPFGVVSRNIRYKNYYGEFLCRYNIFIEDVSSSVSYIMIALLCFQCWHALAFKKPLSPRIMASLCVMTWLLLIAICSLELVFSFVVREWADLWEISCVVNADHRDVELILIIVSCYVPFLLSVMFAVWSVVRWINWKRQSTEEQSNKHSVAKAEINNCEVPITGNVILLMIANFVFAIGCWVPAHHFFLTSHPKFNPTSKAGI